MMDLALQQARAGLAGGGVPVGAVLAAGGAVLGAGHNERVQRGDPVAHGEISCLRNAGRRASYTGTTLVYDAVALPDVLGRDPVVPDPDGLSWARPTTFEGDLGFLASRGVEIVLLGDERCVAAMREFQDTLSGGMARGYRRPVMGARKLADLPYAHLLAPHAGATSSRRGTTAGSCSMGWCSTTPAAADATVRPVRVVVRVAVAGAGCGARGSVTSGCAGSGWWAPISRRRSGATRRWCPRPSPVWRHSAPSGAEWSSTAASSTRSTSASPRFTDVVFEDCVLRDVDWSGSALQRGAVRRVRCAPGAVRAGRADGRRLPRRHRAGRGRWLWVAAGRDHRHRSSSCAIAPMLAAAVGITIKDG